LKAFGLDLPNIVLKFLELRRRESWFTAKITVQDNAKPRPEKTTAEEDFVS